MTADHLNPVIMDKIIDSAGWGFFARVLFDADRHSLPYRRHITAAEAQHIHDLLTDEDTRK